VRIVTVGKAFFGDLWRERKPFSLSLSLSFYFPLLPSPRSDFDVGQIYRGASASAAVWEQRELKEGNIPDVPEYIVG